MSPLENHYNVNDIVSGLIAVGNAFLHLAELLRLAEGNYLDATNSIKIESDDLVSKESVFKLLRGLCGDGHQEAVRELLAHYGAKSLPEVPEEQYSKLYQDAVDLANRSKQV